MVETDKKNSGTGGIGKAQELMFKFIFEKECLDSIIIAYYNLNNFSPKKDSDKKIVERHIAHIHKYLNFSFSESISHFADRNNKARDDKDYFKPFYEETRNQFLTMELYFKGFKDGFYKGLKYYNPNSSEFEITATIDTSFYEVIRTLLPPIFTDAECALLSDVSYLEKIGNSLETIISLL